MPAAQSHAVLAPFGNSEYGETVMHQPTSNSKSRRSARSVRWERPRSSFLGRGFSINAPSQVIPVLCLWTCSATASCTAIHFDAHLKRCSR